MTTENQKKLHISKEDWITLAFSGIAIGLIILLAVTP
jgi:hypothetical protein